MGSTEILLIGLATLLIGSADLFGGIAARRAQPVTVTAWSQAAGVPVLVVVAVVVGGSFVARDVLLGVLAGVGAAVGVSALYLGFARGAVGVVAPIAATVAAIVPIVVGLATGERPEPIVTTGLVLALAAIALVSYVPGDRGSAAAGVMFGILSGVGFGGMVIAYAATTTASGLWSAVSGRATAALLAAVVVAASRIDWRVDARVRVPVALAGVLAACGMGAFVAVSQTADLILLGVALGLFPVVTVLLAAVFLGERLARTQWLGVVSAAIAVAMVSMG